LRLCLSLWINELKIKALDKLWDQLANLHQADILPDTRSCSTPKLFRTTVISYTGSIFETVSTYGQEVTLHFREPRGIIYPSFWPILVCIVAEDGSVPVGNPGVDTDDLL
jgi:hypothetical protein